MRLKQIASIGAKTRIADDMQQRRLPNNLTSRSHAMLWRLPAPVRSFLVPGYRRFNSTAALTVPPLRILFCGSDDFSIASLRALSRAQREVPELIESIDVVHRPAKPTGRGLKTLRDGSRTTTPARRPRLTKSQCQSSGQQQKSSVSPMPLTRLPAGHRHPA